MHDADWNLIGYGERGSYFYGTKSVGAKVGSFEGLIKSFLQIRIQILFQHWEIFFWHGMLSLSRDFSPGTKSVAQSLCLCGEKTDGSSSPKI